MNIAICGGTFDPFHRGHLEPLLAVRDVMEWKQIIYIPAYRQPFKTDTNAASGYHRFAMAILATESFDDIVVSPFELDRATISYTVDTLESLRADHPQQTIDWVIGDDNLTTLMDWKRIDHVFELANFVVLSRIMEVGDVPAPLRARLVTPEKRGRCGNIVFAHNPMVPVSSTEIRRRIRDGVSVADLVDRRVSRYIQQNRLYREVHP